MTDLVLTATAADIPILVKEAAARGTFYRSGQSLTVRPPDIGRFVPACEHVSVHAFEMVGLGKAPFAVVDVLEAKEAGLNDHCMFCLTPIHHRFHLWGLGRGEMPFYVGSECIKQVLDPSLAKEARIKDRAFRARRDLLSLFAPRAPRQSAPLTTLEFFAALVRFIDCRETQTRSKPRRTRRTKETAT